MSGSGLLVVDQPADQYDNRCLHLYKTGTFAMVITIYGPL